MKVITIGRSHENDVRIDDPYVGRHHCQIVQHDNGMFTIVDMNSTNGTYVNGRRVFSEDQLQQYDNITIGHTNLPWRSYFPPKSKSYALPIVLGSVGGLLLTIVLTMIIFRHVPDKTFAFKGEYPDAVVVNMVNDDGTPYTIEAIEGQVCVWFEEGTPYKTAKKSIKASGGRIVAQIPEDGYYLVEVPADKVQVFLKRITKENFVDWAYPNMISYSCAVYNYVLDNFYPSIGETDTTPHGDMVQFAWQEYDKKAVLKSYNIGAKDGKFMDEGVHKWLCFVDANNEICAMKDIASSSTSEPIIINMSYGVPLPERKSDNKYYWREATFGEKTMYRITYYHNLKKIYENAKALEGKDYILVIAAGNEGVKVFDSAIISYLRDRLSPKEKEFMDEHVLLVTAGETEERHKDYSNEMEEGRYDPWVTKVGVSDFKYNGKKQRGTSFAAPRAAGILSSVANEMNLTGAEVLKLAKEVTKRDGELTKKTLMQAAKEKQFNTDNNEVTIEGVLRMYLLDNMGGGSVTYYTDKDGNVINAVGEDDPMHPYCQTIYEYRETDFDNTYLAFVVETDKRLDVTPYIENEDKDNLESLLRSAFMVVPKFQYMEREFANKYANMRVRARGTLYVPWGGWRNATPVVMDLRSIELVEREPKTVIKTTHDALTNLTGTRWRYDFSHNPEIEMYDVLQFDDESNGTALSVYQGESTVVSHFHYFYNEEYDGWCITDWDKNIMYFVINGNELNMGFYKPCVINGKNVVFDSRCYYRM